nr:disease resistance-like protein DSC1 [Ipomoea batatas]
MLPHFQSNPLPPQTSDTPSTSKTIEQPPISLVAFPTCDDLDLGGLDLGYDDESDQTEDFRFTLVGSLITEKIIKRLLMAGGDPSFASECVSTSRNPLSVKCVSGRTAATGAGSTFETYCPKPYDGFVPPAEKLYGPWLRAPNRRPSPVTGNRWVVSSDKPDRSTTSYPHHQSQNIVDVTGADHGLVQKENQSTSLSSTLHVPLQSGMHPSSNVSGCNDVLMEQIPNPPIPDGLVISDPKRKRSELDGPQSVSSPLFFDLNGPDTCTLVATFNDALTTGVVVWRTLSIDMTLLVFPYSKRLRQNIFAFFNNKTPIGANERSNSGSKMETLIRLSFIKQSSAGINQIA